MEAIKQWLWESEAELIPAVVNDAKDGLIHPKSQWHSWKSGEAGINPCNYGALAPFVNMVNRHGSQLGRDWIKRHVEDFCAIYWQSRARYGTPPGEGSAIVDGEYVNWDSDILRHVDMAGLVDAAMVFSEVDAAPVKAVAIDWGNWLLSVNWQKKKRETLRMGLPLNSLVAIYEITRDPKWLHWATALLYYGWGDDTARKVENENGDVFTCWDTGYPWEERGGYMGHVTVYSWYIGNMVNAFMRLWKFADANAKALIQDRVLKISEWYVRRGKTPATGSLQGGMKEGSGPWYRDAFELTPKDWKALPDDKKYMRLLTLEWEEIDGRYEDEYFIDSDGNRIARRDHHQPGGPRLTAGGSGFGIANLLWARHAITQNNDDRLLALWMLHDYRGFCNHSSPSQYFSKNQRMGNPYGGAQGKSRGLAWWMLCGWQMVDHLV